MHFILHRYYRLVVVSYCILSASSKDDFKSWTFDWNAFVNLLHRKNRDQPKSVICLEDEKQNYVEHVVFDLFWGKASNFVTNH